jgi:hypothetical protein
MTGLPECVHPARVHLPVGRYASNGEPPPAALRRQPQDAPPQPPEQVADLESWFTATLRQAPPESRAATLADAETAANRRFPPDDVTRAMRRALALELTHGVLIRQQHMWEEVAGPPGDRPAGAVTRG